MAEKSKVRIIILKKLNTKDVFNFFKIERI